MLRPSSYVGAAVSATAIGAEHRVHGAQLALGYAASAAAVVGDVGVRAAEVCGALCVEAVGEERARACGRAARALVPDRVRRALSGDADGS